MLFFFSKYIIDDHPVQVTGAPSPPLKANVAFSKLAIHLCDHRSTIYQRFDSDPPSANSQIRHLIYHFLNNDPTCEVAESRSNRRFDSDQPVSGVKTNDSDRIVVVAECWSARFNRRSDPTLKTLLSSHNISMGKIGFRFNPLSKVLQSPSLDFHLGFLHPRRWMIGYAVFFVYHLGTTVVGRFKANQVKW